MDYKTILVHLDAGRTAAARLESAVELARKFDAHVACLYALSAPPHPSHAMEAGEILVSAQKRAYAEMREAARRGYDECARRTGYARIEWRETDQDALAAVALHARYADLVVIGQKNEEWPSGVSKEFEERLLLAAGRPVLVVPYAFERRGLGERIVIAWNASREAARAVADALPLLQRAKHVHVVAFNASHAGGAHGEVPGADIGLTLTRHGVKLTVSQYEARDIDVGNLLLSRAFDYSADMIVMGAWGHSRLQELVMGGVTRTLLQSMTVPVLMSH
ncbi:MAG: universal stress protein [Pseudomonadota bacterium]